MKKEVTMDIEKLVEEHMKGFLEFVKSISTLDDAPDDVKRNDKAFTGFLHWLTDALQS